MKLTMPEEITLLLLDDATGRPIGLPAPAGDYALASAILMQLSLDARISTSSGHLVVISAEPTGDPVLDQALKVVVSHLGTRDSRHWIVELGRGTEHFRAMVVGSLTGKGVLRREESRFLWVFADCRYPKPVEGQREVTAVRARLRAVLLHDVAPEPHDAFLIGLARAAGLIPLLLTDAEQREAGARVEQLADREELAWTLSSITRDVHAMMLAFAGVR